MASYGDIVEIDGQFFEFTPVGYMPVNTGGMLTDPVLDSGLEQPPFEEVERQDTLRDRLESMLGGIGQSELGAIWADPTMVEILTANSIRMNPDAPYDIGQATGITADALAELITFVQEIEAAGGYEEWLAQQPTGDPGDLEPPPAPEPEPEPESEVTQVPISEADFNEQFPDVDPSEYTESGTYTDPETGIVYVINIPPPVEEEPTEEEPGGGGEEAPTEEEGEPTEEQPEEEEVIVDPTDSTVDDEDAETGDTIPTDTIEEPEPEPEPPVKPEEEEATPSPFFRVENGQVYVLDYETGEYVLADPAVYEGYLGRDPEDGVYTDQGVRIEDEDIILDLPDLPVIFDPSQTPDFPGGPAPIPEQEPEEPTTPTEPTEPTEQPTEPTEPTEPAEPVPPVEEVPETPEEPTPPAEEPEQPTEETEPTPTTEQPTEQPTPTEEAPETPEQPGTETPSDTPTTGTDETGTAGEGEGDGTGTGTGTGEGEGEGDGTGTGEKRDGLFDDYKEFMTSIGYQPVQMQQLIAPPKKDYFRELDSLIGRSLFGKMI